MRNRIVLTVIVVATFAFLSVRIAAITYGLVDTANAYSNVGAFIVKSPTTGNIFPICSGTLIAPDVFLTASHCTVFFTDDWPCADSPPLSASINRSRLAA